MNIGPYTGFLPVSYCRPDLLSALADLPALLRQPDNVVVSATRNRNVKVCVPCGGRPLDLMVKAFARQSGLKDWADRRRGSKARRTWETAIALRERGVGTPPPVGFLERWTAGRLAEGYFLAEYAAGVTSFKDELIRLFWRDPECEKFMTLIQTVAEAIRRMHDAGVQHNDLGNQNILLRRTADAAWGDVQFIDLNRAVVRESLAPRQRARDISRIHLPSDFLRVFKDMYFAGAAPPGAFQRWERFHRRAYALHCATRALRHPARTRRRRRAEQGQPNYLEGRDLWVWDERSGQAVSTLRSRERGRYRSRRDYARMAGAVLRGGLPVWREYSALLAQCYASPVDMRDRVCVAINPQPATLARELSLLRGLGRVPALVRFCHHESAERRSFLAGVVRDLRAAGHSVSAALVQDRRAVREPARWREFAREVLERIGADVQWVEVGHAVNRVKWGVWSLDEHRRLLEAAAEVAGRHPGVRFTGPAVIDFEYPYLMAAVRQVPEPLRFWALSHHLYVDRRGAPERRQGRFSALEKFALARAIARGSPGCEGRLIVSEVNWPLRGTGVYSPVGAPYVSPGPRFNDPSVSEDDYADYMIRYLLIALCSGMVEQVCWWRLVARGYGLVDDSQAANWRERPAYGMLKQFLDMMGDARFVRHAAGESGVRFFHFDSPRHGGVCLAYTPDGERTVDVPFDFLKASDAMGQMLDAGSGRPMTFTGRPIYLFGKKK